MSTNEELFSLKIHISMRLCNVDVLNVRDESQEWQWICDELICEKFVAAGRWVFAFEMKFYPTEPATLHEDLTRYAAVVFSFISFYASATSRKALCFRVVRLSVRPFFVCTSVILSLYLMDIMSVGIAEKVSKVRGQIRWPTKLHWRRHTFRRCGIEAHLLILRAATHRGLYW